MRHIFKVDVGEDVHLHVFLTLTQLVEALRYMPEGYGFDFWWDDWNFLYTEIFRPQYCSGVDSASNKNGYQRYLLG